MPFPRKSLVWDHFTDTKSGNRAQCIYCSQFISFGKSGTSNLTRHLRTKHRTLDICQAPDPTQSQLQDSQEPDESQPEPPLNSSSPTDTKQIKLQPPVDRCMSVQKRIPVQDIDYQIVKMVLKGYHPLSLVEEPEFRNIFKLIYPDYCPPDRKTVATSLIPHLYNLAKADVQRQLQEAASVSITTDGWTSVRNECFVAITAHFINSQHELTTQLLACDSFTKRHTEDKLNQYMTSTFKAWGIDHKIAAVVTDPAANIVAAVKNGKWPHVGCFAHKLNLSVQIALKHIDTLLNKVRSIVLLFKKHPQNQAMLTKNQELLQLPSLKLKLDDLTRWNSTQDMLNRLVSVKIAVISTVTNLPEAHEKLLSTTEWLILEEVDYTLSLLNDVTVAMSSDKNPTLSKLPLYIESINTHLEGFKKTGNQFVEVLSRELSSRCSDFKEHHLMAEAVILDPRFKKYGLGELTNQFDIYCIDLKQRLASIEIHDHDQTTARTSVEDKLFEQFDQRVMNLRGEIQNDEFDKYMEEPLLQRSKDPLKWWEERKAVYPRLYIMMKSRLCIPASSVPCDRLFSKAGQLLTTRRSNLALSKLEEVVFLHNNL